MVRQESNMIQYVTAAEGRVNFSIHLPDSLAADLDAFAQTRQTSPAA